MVHFLKINLTLWCYATIWINYFTLSRYLNTLKNQALSERKSIVSGRVLGLRLTAFPLTIDWNPLKRPFHGIVRMTEILVNFIYFYWKTWNILEWYEVTNIDKTSVPSSATSHRSWHLPCIAGTWPCNPPIPVDGEV